MEVNRKFTMIIITLIMDVVFIYIILKTKHTIIDKYYILTLLLIHIIFIFALIFNMNHIIDICHILYALSFLIGTLFICNKNILKLLIILILAHITMRLTFLECIMFTSKKNLFNDLFGKLIFNNTQYYILILLCILILSYKILM